MLSKNKSKLIIEDSEKRTKSPAPVTRRILAMFFWLTKFDFVNKQNKQILTFIHIKKNRLSAFTSVNKVKFLKSRNHRRNDAHVILIVQYFYQTQIFHSWREERKSRISQLMLKLIIRFIKRSSSSLLRAERNVLSLIISYTVSGPGIFMTYEMCLQILSSSFVFTFRGLFTRRFANKDSVCDATEICQKLWSDLFDRHTLNKQFITFLGLCEDFFVSKKFFVSGGFALFDTDRWLEKRSWKFDNYTSLRQSVKSHN